MTMPILPLGIVALMSVGVEGCSPTLDPIEPNHTEIEQLEPAKTSEHHSHARPWKGAIDEESCAQVSRLIYDRCLKLERSSEGCESDSLDAYKACTSAQQTWRIPTDTWL